MSESGKSTTGRQSLSRRRSSRSSQAVDVDENGQQTSCDMNLPLRENYVKCYRHDKLQDTKSIIIRGSKPVAEEPKLAKEDSQETRHLKELLLLHLDLIQQQEELILAKDKLNVKLKKDNEALRCRLERMDRRMALLRQKGGEDGGGLSSTTPAAPSNAIITAPVSAPSVTNGDAVSRRGHKRRHSLKPQNLSKRFASASRSDPDRTASPRRHRLDIAAVSKKPTRCALVIPQPENIPKRPNDSYFMPKNKEYREQCGGVDKQKLDKCARQAERKIPRKDILQTETVYYVPQIVNPPPLDISPKKTSKDSVQVPTWRIKHIPRAWTLEGTENLEDEIYIKRHQKPEKDEKQRKRWDLQKMREQKMYEKMQQQQMTGKLAPGKSSKQKQDSTEIEKLQFQPHLDDLKYIQVCDELPVAAFGCPLPPLLDNEFDLPWFDSQTREQEEKLRPCRSRKR